MLSGPASRLSRFETSSAAYPPSGSGGSFRSCHSAEVGIRPFTGLTVAGCIRDAAPDAWGQRVILQRHNGHLSADSDTGDLGLLTYLFESGSDRIGALDFQASATAYQPRTSEAALDEMVDGGRSARSRLPLSPALENALLYQKVPRSKGPKVDHRPPQQSHPGKASGSDGDHESTESWADVLRDLKRRG